MKSNPRTSNASFRKSGIIRTSGPGQRHALSSGDRCTIIGAAAHAFRSVEHALVTDSPTSGSAFNRLPVIRELWQQHGVISGQHMRAQFAADPGRAQRYSLEIDGLLLDYSRNRIDDNTLQLLTRLPDEAGLHRAREQMFTGAHINYTEDRAVLHTALRTCGSHDVNVDGRNVIPEVRAELRHMADFCGEVRSGAWLGYTGKPVTDIVNIGIGGSDLGPRMVCTALRPLWHERLSMHFISNVDGMQIEECLAGLQPDTTLFIVASKTFTTQETLTNAMAARQWFLQSALDTTHIARHFVAVSTNRQAVESFGIDPGNMFVFWDWVGGRYSLWSAIGLSIMLAIGEEGFQELLGGAHAMDMHFLTAPWSANMPVIMALLGFWYRHFFAACSQAVLPYDYLLRVLPLYLQQADMESNGKSVDREGHTVDYPTAPILWGGSGIDGQHSFYQLLHQGTHLVPVDFIASMQPLAASTRQHDIMISNVIAQGEALMVGRNAEETAQILAAGGIDATIAQQRLPHMIFAGNHPSNTLFFDRITPHSLGMLLALYEHKIFVQGVLWNINSYDQWGVELGKQLARKVLEQLHAAADVGDHDASTNQLINHYRQHCQRPRED
ncbi:MAG: glucose-6-phosphate isomerase [Gammaproteobacteria bacterium]